MLAEVGRKNIRIIESDECIMQIYYIVTISMITLIHIAHLTGEFHMTPKNACLLDAGG